MRACFYATRFVVGAMYDKGMHSALQTDASYIFFRLCRMNITLSVDDVSFPISYSMTADLVLGLDEYLPEQRQALICLANHNDYTVRAVVAGKENLPQECYRQLADDASVEVLSELLTNKSFHQYGTVEIYQKMLQRDPRLLSEISSNINMIEPELLPQGGAVVAVAG